MNREIEDLRADLGRGAWASEIFKDLKEVIPSLILQAKDPFEQVQLARGYIQACLGLDIDSVEGFMGIKVLERFSSTEASDDCFTYLFGKDADVQQITDDMLATYTMSGEPLCGTYVLYLDRDFNPRHIGIMTQDGTVVSKWGSYAHVYEHQPLMAPLTYGPNIVYFSPPK